MTRTTWVEEQVTKFCAAPLTLETTFLRSMYWRGTLQRELCDLLLALRGEGIVLSLKSQEDPTVRRGTELAAWCGKAAKKAAAQLGGAMRTVRQETFFCQHPRRGLMQFAPAQITVRHGIAVLEAQTDVVKLPDGLPDAAYGAPFTYFSLNDALNVVTELRAFPDLTAYLDARLKLPLAVRRIIGKERLLYQYYLLNDETFDGCQSLEYAASFVKARENEFKERLKAKMTLDQYTRMVEHVSDALATRAPDYAVGLDPATLAGFDSDTNRKNYLRLQEELCGLRLVARRNLGEAFDRVHRKVAESRKLQDMVYCAILFDEKPDFLYVLAASCGIERQKLLSRTRFTLNGALAWYRVRQGMALVDRDGAGYEVCLTEFKHPTDTDIKAGQELFGTLRMMTIAARTLPAHGN